MITLSKHLATMEERVKNLQRNDAKVSIIGLHEYKLGHVHYHPGYCPHVSAHVLLAVGPVTFSFPSNLMFGSNKIIEIKP